MEIAEKREQIASCIVDLKKGLKKIRREDIDGAIKLLLLYDQDLKRIAKLPAKPIERQSEIKYDIDYTKVTSDRSVEALIDKPITVAIINGDNGSWAYPLHGTLENTVAGITGGHIQPLARVQVDPWMKEHKHQEIAFISVYATVVSGKIVVKNEDILTVGTGVCLRTKSDETLLVMDGDKGKIFTLTKLDDSSGWLDRGWLSIFPVKRSRLVPVKKTEVKYFIIEKWEQ